MSSVVPVDHSRTLIYRCASRLVGRRVVLVIRKFEFGNVFEREVVICRVWENCIVGRGLCGMEWPYPILDKEWAILDVRSVDE